MPPARARGRRNPGPGGDSGRGRGRGARSAPYHRRPHARKARVVESDDDDDDDGAPEPEPEFTRHPEDGGSAALLHKARLWRMVKNRDNLFHPEYRHGEPGSVEARDLARIRAECPLITLDTGAEGGEETEFYRVVIRKDSPGILKQFLYCVNAADNKSEHARRHIMMFSPFAAHAHCRTAGFTKRSKEDEDGEPYASHFRALNTDRKNANPRYSENAQQVLEWCLKHAMGATIVMMRKCSSSITACRCDPVANVVAGLFPAEGDGSNAIADGVPGSAAFKRRIFKRFGLHSDHKGLERAWALRAIAQLDGPERTRGRQTLADLRLPAAGTVSGRFDLDAYESRLDHPCHLLCQVLTADAPGTTFALTDKYAILTIGDDKSDLLPDGLVQGVRHHKADLWEFRAELRRLLDKLDAERQGHAQPPLDDTTRAAALASAGRVLSRPANRVVVRDRPTGREVYHCLKCRAGLGGGAGPSAAAAPAPAPPPPPPTTRVVPIAELDLALVEFVPAPNGVRNVEFFYDGTRGEDVHIRIAGDDDDDDAFGATMVGNAHKYDDTATKLKFRVTANQMVQEKIKGMEQMARAATESLLPQGSDPLTVKSTIRYDHNGATLYVTMGFGHARSRLPVPEIDVRDPSRSSGWRRVVADSYMGTAAGRQLNLEVSLAGGRSYNFPGSFGLSWQLERAQLNPVRA